MCTKLFGPKTRLSRVPVWLYVNGGLTVWLFLCVAALQPRLPAAGSSSGTGQTSSEPLTQLSDSHVMLCQQIKPGRLSSGASRGKIRVSVDT